MSEPDFNPARRLHDIVSRGPRPGDNVKAWQVFSDVLGVPTDQSSLLFARIGQVFLLADEIKERVEAIPGENIDLYLSWYPKAAATIGSFNLHNNWKSFADGFPPQNLTALNFCADLLARTRGERKVTEPARQSLLDQVNSLISDLDSVELRSPDWFFIHHHLLKIKEVLESYEIGGIKPIEDAYSQAIGAMALSPVIVQALKEHEKGKRFYRVVGAVATMLSIYGGVSSITHDVSSLIDGQGLFGSEAGSITSKGDSGALTPEEPLGTTQLES